tara:strand:+ start:381 stop:761 length:381 start_codon:yes stop_codon:yes gene_type:complete
MKNNKANKVEHTQNLQECVDYIMDNRSGWSQFTVWYMEKQGTNRQRANRVWTEAWGIITDDFEDNVKQSIAETMLKLEQIEESAMADNDRRMWLEVVKYRNKIKGGEIERHQVEHKGNVTINVNFE